MSQVICVGSHLVRSWIPVSSNNPFKEKETLPHSISLQSLKKPLNSLRLSNKWTRSWLSLLKSEIQQECNELPKQIRNIFSEMQHWTPTGRPAWKQSSGYKAAWSDCFPITHVRFSQWPLLPLSITIPSLAHQKSGSPCSLDLKSLWWGQSFFIGGWRYSPNEHTYTQDAA